MTYCVIEEFLSIILIGFLYSDCRTNVDVGFIIDGSGSIRDANPTDGSFDNWALLLDFVSGMIGSFPPEETRVGAVLFSDQGQLLFNFERYTNDLGAAEDFVLMTDYPGANTNTSGGLYIARTLLFATSQSRTSSRSKLAIVITDGKSTYDSDKTIPIAKDLRQDDVEIISVGVTSSIDEEELKAISSLPQIKDKNYYTSENFQQLGDISNNILTSFCALSPTKPSLSTSSSSFESSRPSQSK